MPPKSPLQILECELYGVVVKSSTCFFTFLKHVVPRAFTASYLMGIQNVFALCLVTDGELVVFDCHQGHLFITLDFSALPISLE